MRGKSGSQAVYRRKCLLNLSMAVFAILACSLISPYSFMCNEAAPSEDTESQVVTLTKDNFDSFIENDLVLVEFYAPWCSHCKELAPQYEKAAKMLAKEGSSVKLGKVDATEELDIADKYGVKGYPTLQLLRKKVPEEYTGGRTAEGIVEWIKKMTGPAVTTLDSKALAALKETKPSVVFLGLFKQSGSDLHKMFEGVAESRRNVGLFAVFFGDDQPDKVVVMRADENDVEFTGKTEAELGTFVDDESRPEFGAINAENFRHYVERSQELVWFCGSKEDYEQVKEPMREVARKFRREYSIVWLDTVQYKGHAEGSLALTEFPGLVYQSKTGRYVLPDKNHLKSAADIIKFFTDVKDGKIEKSFKSEPVPETNAGPVMVVVGKNFEEIVLQKDKDVMLEVYAPWCGHCKTLEPIYKEFAESLANVKHVVIAKMDGTANEAPVEGFDWTGFPALFWVKAGTNTPLRFDGGRTLDALQEYVKKHSSKPINDGDLTPPAGKAESGRHWEL